MGFVDFIVVCLLFVFLTVPLTLGIFLLTRYFGNRTRQQVANELERHFQIQREWMENRMRILEEQALVRTVAPPPAATAPQPKISEDKLMVLGAVLACHFGKRVKIRTARVISIGSGANVWSQQGRAAVQASHTVVR